MPIRSALCHSSLGVVTVAAVAVVLATAALPSHAREPRKAAPSYGASPTVTAESHFGRGTVTGAVREGRNGLEVQLPGGTWIECGRHCTETLRRQSIDFWDSNGPQAKDSGRGYLSWGF